MTSVGPPEFDVGESGPDVPGDWTLTTPTKGTDPEPPPAAPGWLAAAVVIGVVVGAIALLALALRTDRPTQAAPTLPTTSVPTTVAPVTVAETPTTLPAAVEEPRYFRGLVDPVVAQITPHGNGYVGFVASSEIGQLALVTSHDGFTWSRNNSVDAAGLPSGFDPLGMWSSLVGELFAFGRFDGRYGLALSRDHGNSWELLFEIETTAGEEIVPVFALTLGPGGVWLQVAELDGEGEEVTQRSFEAVWFEGWRWREVAGDLGPLEGATWSSRGLLALRAPSSIEEFVSPNWRQLAHHDLSTGDVEDFSVLGLQEPVLALMHLDREILAAGFDRSYRYVTDTDVWEPIGQMPVTPFDRLQLLEIVTTNDGFAMLWFDEFVPVARGRYTVVASHDLVDWTTVRITEEFVTLTIKTIGDEEVLLEGVIEAAGPRRVRVPTEPRE